MIKFTFKAGVALGTIYFMSEQGLWKDSNQSTKLYNKICETASPYVLQAKDHLPVEIPDLPKSNILSYLVKQTWNKGINVSCMFLGDLPDNITKWTRNGFNLVMSNEEVKKLYNSLGSSVEEKSKS